MNFSLFIAKRYLSTQSWWGLIVPWWILIFIRSTNAVHMVTSISIRGIATGTAALIVVLSAFNGISSLVFGLYNTFDPDIKITPKEGKTFMLEAALAEKIKKVDGVICYTEVLQENALLKYDEKQVIATIKGVSDDFVKMTRLDTVTREGEFILHHDSIDYAVLGYGLARRLNISLTDFLHPLEIYVPKRGTQAVLNPEDAFLVRSVEVSGVFSLNDDFDYRFAILPLSLSRTLLGRSNELSAIELGLEKGADIETVKANVLQILGNGEPGNGGNGVHPDSPTPPLSGSYEVKTRYEQNEVLFKTINSEKWWTFLILAFILVIATFNMIGSLTMLIIEKKKDIQTLMFLGADKNLVREIFMKEGLMITLTGAFSGLLIGLAICWIQVKFKLVPFSEGFIVDSYPIKIVPTDLALVFCTVLLIGFFAAWYPVRIFTKKF